MTKKDLTAAERKRRERERMKSVGLNRREFYVHDDDLEEVKILVEKKKTKHLKKLDL
ncbi:hypothetical protein [Aliikangiella maris]|uniref:Uncharacterized protein n=2 Tax=Aliikangiella maris TaxID=3162458 RepID=A0ABV3MTX7_9GAMM